MGYIERFEELRVVILSSEKQLMMSFIVCLSEI